MARDRTVDMHQYTSTAWEDVHGKMCMADTLISINNYCMPHYPHYGKGWGMVRYCEIRKSKYLTPLNDNLRIHPLGIGTFCSLL